MHRQLARYRGNRLIPDRSGSRYKPRQPGDGLLPPLVCSPACRFEKHGCCALHAVASSSCCRPITNATTSGPITNGILAGTSDVDVLIVDDNSPDGTGRLADEITAREKRVRALENVVGRRVGGGNARMVYARFAVLRPKAMSRIAPAPICLAA
jgi:Glycosyl transferase family 2